VPLADAHGDAEGDAVAEPLARGDRVDEGEAESVRVAVCERVLRAAADCDAQDEAEGDAEPAAPLPVGDALGDGGALGEGAAERVGDEEAEAAGERLGDAVPHADADAATVVEVLADAVTRASDAVSVADALAEPLTLGVAVSLAGEADGVGDALAHDVSRADDEADSE